MPDVSMLADVAPGYASFCSSRPGCVNRSEGDESWSTQGGTSYASPLLAGGLALVDEDLRVHSRPDLGFVNPLLYTLGRNPADAPLAFDDVTEFGNDIGPFIQRKRPFGCCTAGPGYDEASGWGSVNLANFAALVMQRG
jgi:subtilase family serine protease